MAQVYPGDDLTEDQARAALIALARELAAANLAYHRDDAPILTDAAYDALKRRNMAIEARFPHLKRAGSASDQVGAVAADGFGKISHSVPMLSLENAFDDAEISEFDTRIRKFLGHHQRFGLYG
jgi:DNA ligase (NAD+)